MRVMIRARVPLYLDLALRREARRRMISVSDIMRQAIAKELGMWPLTLPENNTIVVVNAESERQSVGAK